jgi:hypothetical protein
MKTLQKQMDKFYEETGYQLKVKDGKPYYDGYLCLYNSMVTELPDNLVVGGSLNLQGTKITKLPNNLVVDGSLDLYSTKITELPENLVIGGYLNVYGTKITELPERLVVGGHLDLRDTKIIKLPDNLVIGGGLGLSGTKITELPENLVVGGSLDLEGTRITKLPERLVVGDWLDLYGTNITALPDNLMVGGWLDLRDTEITKLPDNLVVGSTLDLRDTEITKLPDNLVVRGSIDLEGTKITELPKNLVIGDYIYGMTHNPITPTLSKDAKEKLKKIRNFLQWTIGNKTYIKVDGIFGVVDNHKGNVWRTHRVGKEELLYVVTDGEGHYAHGNTLKEAKDDLIYKINDRDTSSYENLSLDDEVSFEEAIAMYRTITGACAAGTRDFVENRLPKPHKEMYSIKEIIDLTDGEYGSETFKDFLTKRNESED